MDSAIAIKWLKDNWLKILVALVIIGVLIYIGVLRSKLSNRDEEVKTLKSNIMVMQAAMDSRDKIIDIQKGALDLFEQLQLADAKSEWHYQETVKKSSTVIEKFIESAKTEEDYTTLYNWENNMWDSLADPLKQLEGPE